MRGTVAKRIKRSVEVGLHPEDLVNLYATGGYKRLLRRLKRGYTRGDVNAKQMSHYYGELEKIATNKTNQERVAL